MSITSSIAILLHYFAGILPSKTDKLKQKSDFSFPKGEKRDHEHWRSLPPKFHFPHRGSIWKYTLSALLREPELEPSASGRRDGIVSHASC